MDPIIFLKFSYCLVIGTFVLMLYTSLCGAREFEMTRHPPCHFNSLCSCSKDIPDLGIVRCQDVHLPRIPERVNMSKVFTLHLENNGLKWIEPYFLQSTGLYRVVISHNPLSFIPDEAFLGLERSLWELDLSYNQLTRIPNRAFRYLQKLRYLDLRGNDIVGISPENWRGIENSLITLILTDNSINHLPIDSFSGLPFVETIDLKGNNLREIDPSVFRDGMGRLANLILADNQLVSIPYQALSYLKSLRNLDLSYNGINKMQPVMEVGVQSVNYNFQLNLDLLKLDYNQITALEPLAFQYFNVLNKTYLDGNPLSVVGENAFRQAKIRELYIRNCKLEEISSAAFGSLENYLEVLDLSGNHISLLSEGAFHRFEALRGLSLKDNFLARIDPHQFNSFHLTLNKLDLSGNENAAVKLQDLRRLRSLRVLSLSKLSQASLSSDDFLEYGVDLEELEITFGGLQTIKSNAFKHLHGLRKILFSDNVISSIEKNAFSEVGHSLMSLKLSHALSSSVKSLPSDALKDLTNLEILDLSNNRIKDMPETSFHFLKKLRELYLQDNVIDMVYKGTFQGDIHGELTALYLSFNNLRSIQQHSFTNLMQLEQLHLDDNKIETLETRSFMNLENLKRLNLKGNKIRSISFETFQNLPELEDLDLSFNKLDVFEFNIFDQVGTLGMFRVNVSYNRLINLVLSSPSDFDAGIGMGSVHSNIKILDLSNNNITHIAKHFFRPTELSLTNLYLSHNKILNATKDVFGNMRHLQILDISHNILYELDFDAFRNTRSLQVLDVSYNRIAEVPGDLFRFLGDLRIVHFSHNRLRVLPDNLFRDAGLERLDVSHNLLGKLPLTSLSVASAMTLCELDISWNNIASLAHGGMLSRFKSLTWIDLSYNKLAQIDPGAFKGLPRLSSLNLGHNSQLTLDKSGLSFEGLEYSLLHLNLDNISTSNVPVLPTPNLVSLSLAHNSLPTIALEMAANITGLQVLNLNYNDLSLIPVVTLSLPELRYLFAANNPIRTLTNTSLLGVAHSLLELDLRNVDLTELETGAFCKMQSLRTLRIDVYKKVKFLNIPKILQNNQGLKNLEVHFEGDGDIESEMLGEMPSKLQNLTFSGKGVVKLSARMFQGIRSPSFHLCLRNTSVTKVSSDIFKSLTWVKNVSIDVRDNMQLKTLQNPSTGLKPNLPRSTFLTGLKLTGSKWSCDCELGWVEVWLRKRHQHLCGTSLSVTSSYWSPEYTCRHVDDDLRTTLCASKNNQSLIEVLKTDIECGWSSATSIHIMRVTFLISYLLVLKFVL